MQQQTISDQINKVQQQIDIIDDAIAYKREIILRGSTDEELKTKVRCDILGLLEDREELCRLQLTMKMECDKNNPKTNNNGKDKRKEDHHHGR